MLRQVFFSGFFDFFYGGDIVEKINLGIIKQKRLDKNLLQKDVAKAIGVKTSTYSSYELGTRQMTLLRAKALANLLGISIEDFFY